MKTKPFSKTKSIVTYVVCGVLIVALAIGNYYASLYKDLITVYTSGSDVVTTDESAKVCQTIEEEGMVLLKNEDVLPLKEGAKVSLLGQDSVDFVYGGSGSGSVDTSQALNLKKAMEASGFEVNETLWDFYDSGAGKDYRKSVPDETGAGEFAVNEVPASVYTDDVKDSFKDYNDAAIVCIGRSGGESADIPTEPLANGYKYLELDQDERDMLTMACQNFDNVVVLVNANNAMELGFLNDEAYKNVKACVWVGGVGQEGIKAVAEALAGKTNFSGHLADTYAYDSQSAPSIENIGDFTITNSDVTNGNKYTVYSEGIYVGYRYYETRYEDAVMGSGNAGDYDYTSTVQFPFGYGLSYTDFKWSDYSVEDKGDTYEVSVTVKNTGDVAGKDVVEVYMQSPYTDYDKENGIEKSAVELVGFTKTDSIEPGKDQTVTVSVDKEVMKAYDAANAKTYVVDAGDYYFTAASDAHEALNNILAAKGYTTENGMDADGNADMTYKTTVDTLDTTTYAKSTETGNDITNQFADVDIRYYDDSFAYLTRSDWSGSFPSTYADGNMTASDALLSDLQWDRSNDVVNDGSAMPEFEQDSDKKVSDAKDASYDDEIWSELVSKLSADRAMQLVRQGGYATIQADDIGLPATTDKDGTSGISGTLVGGQSAMAYPVEAVMACTWNTDLLYEMGLSLGEDSINTGVAGWYAPGVDIHRSPYSGRNFEYYSEDPYLSATMSVASTGGIKDGGTWGTIKHFALNGQESHRFKIDAVCSERAIREIYLKSFEMAVKEGTVMTLMTSYNPINGHWAASNYDLCTTVLRGEWGYKGIVMTDWWAKMNDVAFGGEESNQDTRDMVRSQNDVYMVVNNNGAEVNSNNDNTESSVEAGTLTVGELQRAAINICNFILSAQVIERELIDTDVANHYPSVPVSEAKYEQFNLAEDNKVMFNGGKEATMIVEEDAEYTIIVNIAFEKSNLAQSTVNVNANGENMVVIQTNGTDGNWITQKLCKVKLDKGAYNIKLEDVLAGIKVKYMQFKKLKRK